MGIQEFGLSRREWVEACRFHEMEDEQVLSSVFNRVEMQKDPVVVLDLDSTLYEVAPRSFQIIQEWARVHASAMDPLVSEAMKRLREDQVGYSLRDTWSAIGLRLGEDSVEGRRREALFSDLRSFWKERFFSNDYLRFDRPYPGAVPFVRRVHELGARIIYLTGRDEPGMGDGTRDKLQADAFPWGESKTHLILKRVPEVPDSEHKKGAVEAIRGHGSVVASFENEPANLAMLHHRLPDAMHVFVDTVCSDHPAPSREGLYRIRGFSSSP